MKCPVNPDNIRTHTVHSCGNNPKKDKPESIYIHRNTNYVWLKKEEKRQVSYNSVAFWWKNYSRTGARAARALLKKDGPPLSITHSGGRMWLFCASEEDVGQGP